MLDEYMQDNWRQVCADRYGGDFSALARYADQVGSPELRDWARAEYAKASAAPADTAEAGSDGGSDPSVDPIAPEAPADPSVDPIAPEAPTAPAGKRR